MSKSSESASDSEMSSNTVRTAGTTGRETATTTEDNSADAAGLWAGAGAAAGRQH